jgi:serine/threonine-protein kinase HipA
MTLEVLLGDRRVGTLAREASTPVIAFTLDRGYVDDRDRPILSQRFEDRRQTERFRQSKHPGRLPSFFANLMPEGALHDMIAAQVPGEDVLAMLARIGGDLPGAVIVRPPSRPEAPRAVQSVFDESASKGSRPPEAWRFSLAGVQLKMSATRDAQARFTLPFAHADGRWILKFGSPTFPSLPENEYAVMRWAAEAGIAVPRHELLDAAAIDGLEDRLRVLGERVYAIERYDRGADHLRIHQEDFAQVLGLDPEKKYDHATYESLAWLVATVCGEEDLREYLRRVIFMILAGNFDAHLKNWSLIYPEPRVARLSPAYDLVGVTMYPTVPRRLALKLAGEVIPAALTWGHVERVERFLGKQGVEVSIVEEARTFARSVLDAWQQVRALAPAPLQEATDAHLATLKLRP